MKITFILPIVRLSGGVRVVATYARKLLERGHEVTVVSAAVPPPPPLKSALKRLTGQPLKRPFQRTDFLDFLGERHITLDWSNPARAARTLPDADVVFATWWETAEWVAMLPPSKGRKFYLLQDYEMFPGQPAERVAATFRLPMTRLAVSGYIRDVIAEAHGVTDVSIVPNSVDLRRFDAPERGRNDCLTVGFVHTMKPRKTVDLAIDAVTALRAELPDLRVVAFGAKLKKAQAHLPDWVAFEAMPPQERIPQIYASCDLWLFPSESEGFGLPILEAMACRTPVLATRAGAAPDLIDGSNGILTDGTAEAFVEGMRRFAAMTPETWRGYSDAAWRTAHGYSWDDATDLLLRHIAERAPA